MARPSSTSATARSPRHAHAGSGSRAHARGHAVPCPGRSALRRAARCSSTEDRASSANASSPTAGRLTSTLAAAARAAASSSRARTPPGRWTHAGWCGPTSRSTSSSWWRQASTTASGTVGRRRAAARVAASRDRGLCRRLARHDGVPPGRLHMRRRRHPPAPGSAPGSSECDQCRPRAGGREPRRRADPARAARPCWLRLAASEAATAAALPPPGTGWPEASAALKPSSVMPPNGSVLSSHDGHSRTRGGGAARPSGPPATSGWQLAAALRRRVSGPRRGSASSSMVQRRSPNRWTSR